ALGEQVIGVPTLLGAEVGRGHRVRVLDRPHLLTALRGRLRRVLLRHEHSDDQSGDGEDDRERHPPAPQEAAAGRRGLGAVGGSHGPPFGGRGRTVTTVPHNYYRG